VKKERDRSMKTVYMNCKIYGIVKYTELYTMK